jgi:hypothetical protein
VCGGGHLTRDGKRVSIYTSVAEDARALSDDLAALGFHARVFRRSRGAGRHAEIHLYVGSRRLHRTLAELGSPVGRKRWPLKPMRWLLEAPTWVRAQFVSAFASAELTAPRVVGGCVANLAMKQADPNAARLLTELIGSLGFTTSIAPSSGQWVLHIVGGEEEQLRFIEEIGFCRAYEKRLAAARAAGVAWQRRELLRLRAEAHRETEVLYAAGVGYGRIVEHVSGRFEVPRGFVHHALYDERTHRRGRGVGLEPCVAGEGVWVRSGRCERRRRRRCGTL